MINLGEKSLYKIIESLRFSVSSVPYTSKYFVQTLKQLGSSLLCFVTQLCQILCDLMDCSLPGSSVLGDSPGKNTGVGFHALLQGIFPTQGWNPDLPHGSRFFYCLRHQGSPRNLEWVGIPSPEDLPDTSIKPGLLHCRRILYQLSDQESPYSLLVTHFSETITEAEKPFKNFYSRTCRYFTSYCFQKLACILSPNVLNFLPFYLFFFFFLPF